MERLNPLQIFSAKSSGNALTTRNAEIKNCSADEALIRASLLLGCYRKMDCADPEVFATAAVAVFSRYPLDVVRKVTDPYSGLAARLKWVPTIYEIREACEIANNEARRREESDARVKAQFAERERIAAMSDPDRRKAFVRREMDKINVAFASADTGNHPASVDIRGMEECAEKQALRAKLNQRIDGLSASYHADPVKASERLLASIGINAVASCPADSAFDDAVDF